MKPTQMKKVLKFIKEECDMGEQYWGGKEKNEDREFMINFCKHISKAIPSSLMDEGAKGK